MNSLTPRGSDLSRLSTWSAIYGTYYRCAARSLAPGSQVLAEHPRTVNLREDALLGPLNRWLARLFDKENRDTTVAALVASCEQATETASHASAKARLRDAEARLRRHNAAIEAGVDPAALIEVINSAQADRVAARVTLDRAPGTAGMSEAEVYAALDYLGDMETVLNEARPVSLARLYEAVRLEMRYEPKSRVVCVTTRPCVASAGVRGGSCALNTRLDLF